MSKSPSLFRSTLMLTGVGLVSQVFSFVYRIIMARLVGAQVLGLYQLIMPAYAVIQSICVSGLAVSVSVLSSEYHARKNEIALRQLMATGLRGLFLLWLPVALTVVSCSKFISLHLLGDARTRLGLLLLLPVLLLTGVENLQKHQFYGIGSMRLPAGVELGEQFIRTLAIILLLSLLAPKQEALSVGLIVLGLFISEIFSSIALTWGRKKRDSAHPSTQGVPIASPRLRRQIADIALPVSITALAGNLMGAATSVFIPKLLVLYGMSAAQAMEEFGVMLGMTLPLLMVPTAFINALSLALLPRLSRQRELGQMHDFRKTAEKSMLSVSFVVLPIIALIAALGPDLGALLFADKRVGTHMLPLAVGVVASCYHAILVCMLNALGKQNQSATISLFCGALELVLTVLLVGRIGLSGFVIALIAADSLAVILCLGVVKRAANVRVSAFRCFSAPVLSALLAGLLVNLGYRYGMDAGLGQGWLVLLWGGAGLGVYFLTLLSQGIRPLGLIHTR